MWVGNSTYNRIKKLQEKQPTPLTVETVTELDIFFPELQKHKQQKALQKINAYLHASNDLLALVDKYRNVNGFTELLGKIFSPAALETILKTAMDPMTEKQLEDAKPVGFTKVELTKEQRETEEQYAAAGIDPLEMGYEGKYYPELAIRMKIESGIQKIIARFKRAAEIPEFKTNKPPSKFLDITNDAERRMKFIARFGGGKKQPGIIEREPSWMEIADYHRMMDKFYDVTECSVDLKEQETHIWAVITNLLWKKQQNSTTQPTDDETKELQKKKTEQLFENIMRKLKQKRRKEFKLQKLKFREQHAKMPCILCAEYIAPLQEHPSTQDKSKTKKESEKELKNEVTAIFEEEYKLQYLFTQVSYEAAYEVANELGRMAAGKIKRRL